MYNKKSIKILNKDGIEKEYGILATFDYKDRKFAIYTDYSTDEKNNKIVYSGIYKKDGNIKPVIDANDRKIVKDFIKYFEARLKYMELSKK